MVTRIVSVDSDERGLLHELVLKQFLDGDCYAFALAVSEGTKWPMVGLFEGSVARHACIKTPDGMFFDARGFVTNEDIGAPFGLSTPHNMKLVFPNDLIREGETKERVTWAIARARTFAETLWPNLPWDTSHVDKVRGFIDELEILCLRHGFYISAQIPGMPPMVVPIDGNEDGYTATQLIDGRQYSLMRRFVGE
ncbi:MAG: hypothetical protein K9M10_01175 [Candidatus Pacebacteria bacterium]|nr:hypothetical protein [Candidatus Paceibacterota bacterium]MCF7857075.1 hypothetical protein [Candidatus Paceibacterota bacterium]